jgi:hypothetical protein
MLIILEMNSCSTQTVIHSDWFISLLKQTPKEQYNQLISQIN